MKKAVKFAVGFLAVGGVCIAFISLLDNYRAKKKMDEKFNKFEDSYWDFFLENEGEARPANNADLVD